MELTELLPNIRYFGRDTLDNTEKTIIFFIFIFINVKLVKVPFFSRFLFSMIIVLVLYKYFNKRESKYIDYQMIFEKFKKEYKYLWMNKDILEFLSKISCIKDVNQYRYKNLCKLINEWCFLLYQKYYLKKKISIQDITNYKQLINEILNEFHNIIYDTYYDSKELNTLKNILWSENYIPGNFYKYLSFPLPSNSIDKNNVFI